jgi:transposase
VQVQRITSIPGLGKVVAWTTITATQEFTRISEPKKFACHIGVAPFVHESGTSIRGRTRVSSMADKRMKTLFHLAAMAAIKSSQELGQYYSRKVEAGKNKMSVINAVRNKLITRVFACIKGQRDYEKYYQSALA